MKSNILKITFSTMILCGISDAATTIYVSAGAFANPPYQFFSDSNLTQPLDIYTGGSDSLQIGQTYTFVKSATSHPFYVGDNGYNQTSSPLISLTGNGSAASGIGGGQSFTLSFNGFDPSADTLTYYCTAHSSMVGTLNVIPEPSGSLLLMVGASVIMVGRRSRLNSRR